MILTNLQFITCILFVIADKIVLVFLFLFSKIVHFVEGKGLNINPRHLIYASAHGLDNDSIGLCYHITVLLIQF